VGPKWVISGVNNLIVRREQIHSAVSGMRRAPYWNPAVALNLNLAWERDYWNHLYTLMAKARVGSPLIFINITENMCAGQSTHAVSQQPSYYKIIFHGCGLVTWHRTRPAASVIIRDGIFSQSTIFSRAR